MLDRDSCSMKAVQRK